MACMLYNDMAVSLRVVKNQDYSMWTTATWVSPWMDADIRGEVS